MAKKAKRGKGNDLIILALLFTVFILISFFALGKSDSSDSAETSPKPGGVNVTYEQAFIEKLAPKALEIEEKYQLLPSVTIAQAILESDWGRSGLAQAENNYFGIKGNSESNFYVTHEFDGSWSVEQEPFRSYANVEESMEDYARLLYYGTDWNPAHYEQVVEASTYPEATRALQEAGYATDPAYGQKLNRIIETYELDQYDQIND